MNAIFAFAGATQPSNVDLVLSVLVSVVQLIVGWLLIARSLRPASGRGLLMYILGLLGIWLMGSGAAEFYVSGLMLGTTMFGTVPSNWPRSLRTIRQIADMGLLALAGVLVLALPCYPLWRRLRRQANTTEQA